VTFPSRIAKLVHDGGTGHRLGTLNSHRRIFAMTHALRHTTALVSAAALFALAAPTLADDAMSSSSMMAGDAMGASSAMSTDAMGASPMAADAMGGDMLGNDMA